MCSQCVCVCACNQNKNTCHAFATQFYLNKSPLELCSVRSNNLMRYCVRCSQSVAYFPAPHILYASNEVKGSADSVKYVMSVNKQGMRNCSKIYKTPFFIILLFFILIMPIIFLNSPTVYLFHSFCSHLQDIP